jgi:hypothetical protein
MQVIQPFRTLNYGAYQQNAISRKAADLPRTALGQRWMAAPG